MGIYFRDILLTRISRGANNCGQHPLEKNSYFIMRFSPHFQLFYFNDRLEFCEFFEGKIKRINNADLFSQLPLLIFIKGANISGGHCIHVLISNSHRKSSTVVGTCYFNKLIFGCYQDIGVHVNTLKEKSPPDMRMWNNNTYSAFLCHFCESYSFISARNHILYIKTKAVSWCTSKLHRFWGWYSSMVLQL